MATERILLVANPRAGNQRAEAAVELLRGRFARAGIGVEVVYSRARGHARELAREMSMDGVRAICAVGGDGTVHEVTDGLMARPEGGRPLLCPVPTGSGNALARDLGYDTPSKAADRLLAGETRRIDVVRLEVDGRVMHSINILAWGAAARIDARAERLRWIGGPRYTVASVLELLALRRLSASVRLDGQLRTGDLLGVACSTRYSGRGMLVAPRAKLDDGLLDVVLIQCGNRVRLARLLGSVFDGRHVESPLVAYWHTKGLELEVDSSSKVVVDGELVEAREVKAQVVSRALEVVG